MVARPLSGAAMTREERVSKMIAAAPERTHGILRRAFDDVASPRDAIKAQCLACVGYDRQEVAKCTGYTCPLWGYRPYKPDAVCTSFHGREGDENDYVEQGEADAA
jgi:hypothetical protein